MNYKPEEATLISYLYGELDAKEMEKVAQYLQQNQEAATHLAQLQKTLQVMQTLEDKEVIAPPVFVNDQPGGSSFWRTAYFKTAMSIAASFLLIIVAGKLAGLEINYAAGELRIAFGQHAREEKQVLPGETLSASQVQEMIDASLVENNDKMTARLKETQDQLNLAVNRSVSNSAKIDGLMKEASAASQEQLRTFVASMQKDNLRLMQEYLQLSAKEQKQYVETLLVDFSDYLKEQRNQDLQLFQTRITSMEKNTDQFKQETEQILASIISNGTVRQKNNY